MAVSADVLRTHLDYSAWASGLLVDAVARLNEYELTRDFATSDKNVLRTLVHVFAADRIWLARIRGAPATTFVTDADYHLAVLQKDWPALMNNWKQWAAGLSDETARTVISNNALRRNVLH